ncbi:MAG: FAD-binding oxidoreductase [Sneathiella sp.]|nr:FAD-binding oxidoreductase [Sneathiella sp.]
MRSDRNYYQFSKNTVPDFSKLSGLHQADICIVGAGFTGLGTALELAERGYQVCVLEGGSVGAGASGASGGQVTSGYSPGMIAVEEMAGRDDAAKMWALSERSKEILKRRIDRYQIKCDFKEGEIYAAVKKSDFEWLKEEKQLCEDRFDFAGYELIEKADLPGFINSRRYVGGLLDKEGGHLHPLNYCLGLADAVTSHGGVIYENSRALRYQETGETVTIFTDTGQVQAKALVLAGNAYLNDIAPPLLKRMMPVKSSILATAPLDAERAKSLYPSDVCVCDTNFDLDYFKMSPDNRLIYGGQDFSFLGIGAPWARIRSNMLKTFPDLDDLEIEYFWQGKIAFTRTLLPDAGQLSKNVFYAHGYSGQGVTVSNGTSEILARAVAGQLEALDVFSRLPKKRVPSSKYIQAPAIYLASLWYRLRDILG